MCGRFTLTDPNPRRLASRFDLDGSFEIDERPRFNIAPTDPVIAIRRSEAAKNQAGRLRWGLLPGYWADKQGQRPLINARVETVAEQPAFRDSFEKRRCLIPADGFYEWRKDPEGKRPIWFSPPERDLFAFAGIWARLAARRGRRRDQLRADHVLAQRHGAPGARPDAGRPRPGGRERPGSIPTPIPRRSWRSSGPRPTGRLEPREVGDFVNDVREDGPHLLEPPLKLF